MDIFEEEIGSEEEIFRGTTRTKDSAVVSNSENDTALGRKSNLPADAFEELLFAVHESRTSR
jgi:hypothetical protein